MRCDAQVFLDQMLDYEAMTRYVARKSAEGQKITYMHILIAAYVRAVSKHPEANRFIMNKQYYSRTNCTVSFTMLNDAQKADSGETAVKIKFDLTDTIFDVRDRVDEVISQNRGTETKNFADKLAALVLKMPGLVTGLVWVVRFLDRYGLLPAALIDGLPFHTGLFVTNMASIGMPRVYHHIYNFGSTSLFMSIGAPQKHAVADSEGKSRMRRQLPIGITADERVCSGAHYAGLVSDMLHGLNHPEELEIPPETVRFDPKAEYHVEKVKKQAK